jgi:hypothetical protein
MKNILVACALIGFSLPAYSYKTVSADYQGSSFLDQQALQDIVLAGVIQAPFSWCTLTDQAIKNFVTKFKNEVYREQLSQQLHDFAKSYPQEYQIVFSRILHTLKKTREELAKYRGNTLHYLYKARNGAHTCAGLGLSIGMLYLGLPGVLLFFDKVAAMAGKNWDLIPKSTLEIAALAGGSVWLTGLVALASRGVIGSLANYCDSKQTLYSRYDETLTVLIKIIEDALRVPEQSRISNQG